MFSKKRGFPCYQQGFLMLKTLLEMLITLCKDIIFLNYVTLSETNYFKLTSNS